MAGTLAEANSIHAFARARWAAGFVVAVLLWMAARTAFVPMYRSNDDVSMLLLSQGIGISGHPTPYLLHVNILLGQALIWLHAFAGSIQWYTVVMNLIHLAGVATVVAIALSAGGRLGRWVQAVIFLGAFDFSLQVQPHFTQTSGVAMIGASVLWMESIAGGKRLAGASLAWFLVLTTLSCFVRWQTCALILIASLPAAALETWHWRQHLPKIAPMFFTPFLGAVIVAGGLAAINDGIYQISPGWARFNEFNRIRADFVDYERAPFDDSTRPIFQSLGWSQNDYAMLRSWSFEDRLRFSTEELRRVIKGLPRRPVASPWQVLKNQVRAVRTDSHTQLVYAAVMVSFLAAAGGRRRRIGVTLATALGLAMIIAYVYQRFPPWVSDPLAALVPAIGVAGSDRDRWDGAIRRVLRLIGLGLVGVLLWRELAGLFRQSLASESMSANLMLALHDLRPSPDQLYVDWGGAFPYELLLGTKEIKALAPMHILSLGCTNQTPINQERLDEFHIADLHRAIYQRGNILVIGHPDTPGLLAGYAQDHHHRGLQVRTIMDRELGGFPMTDGVTGKPINYVRHFCVYQFQDAGPLAP